MPKEPFADYLQELAAQRAAWERKAVLRAQYRHWYAQLVAALSTARPVVEIGSGCGNFKAYFPECVATDVIKAGPWIDRVLDAHALDFAPASVGNLVVVDVLHHLQRPLTFLRQAAAALQPGGRLVLCEPAVTPWSRLVYGSSHHEPIDLQWDLFGLADTPPAADPGHTFANQGIGELLFWKQRARTLAAVPGLRLVEARKFGFLLYPLTGGFSYRCFVPQFGFDTLLRIEDFCTRPLANWLTGMRMLVVLEKS